MTRIYFRKTLVFVFLLVTIGLFLELYYPEAGVSSVVRVGLLTSIAPGSPKDSQTLHERKGRPWYISGGTDGLSRVRTKLFPSESPNSDRIEAQLLYSPEVKRTKLILAYNALQEWSPWSPLTPGPSVFNSCAVKDCQLTSDRGKLNAVDAVLFKANFQQHENALPSTKPAGQVWILFNMESPLHTNELPKGDVFNWTSTYRMVSEIAFPYGKWVYYNRSITSLPLTKNYAVNKTKQVAWFVSNCGAKNSRLEYARTLQKFINVDIFGACGTEKCPRSKEEECFKKLDSDYKFYLAFENSNCKGYITEKFFHNGLRHNVIPIAMGARPEDYKRMAPKNSYILVEDFESPEALAAYLRKLDENDDLYNSYFSWKGTGEFIETHFFCRLCALLHAENIPTRTYGNINKWWNEEGVCTRSFWKETNKPSGSFWDWLGLG